MCTVGKAMFDMDLYHGFFSQLLVHLPHYTGISIESDDDGDSTTRTADRPPPELPDEGECAQGFAPVIKTILKCFFEMEIGTNYEQLFLWATRRRAASRRRARRRHSRGQEVEEEEEEEDDEEEDEEEDTWDVGDC
jgi:hypothetical protein